MIINQSNQRGIINYMIINQSNQRDIIDYMIINLLYLEFLFCSFYMEYINELNIAVLCLFVGV